MPRISGRSASSTSCLDAAVRTPRAWVSISIHTQPKGAQIAINQRVLDKSSPVDVMLGPGNYIVDITLTGFKPIHKVVSVDKGGKAAIDEILERQ